MYKKIGDTAPFVNFLDKICQPLICGDAHLVHESDYETDEPRTKQHLSTKDIPSEICFNNYSHWPVLKDIPNSQSCKY